MPTGLKLPVGASPTGGMSTIEGDENDLKIIMIALGSDETENAFAQDEGFGLSSVFEINDPQSHAKVLVRLRRVFERFLRQKRFKLKEDTIVWKQDGGDAILEFKYISLETDSEKTFQQKIPQASSGAGTTA